MSGGPRRLRPWPGVLRVISGAQTGADQGGLDAALLLGIPIGGWVPRGRRSEDGPVPDLYVGLRETETDDYKTRTALNVEMAGGTVVFYNDRPTAGSALTVACCSGAGRPWLEVRLRGCVYAEAADRISAWLAAHRIRVLNIAGSRESKAPGIRGDVRAILLIVLDPWRGRADSV